MPVQCPGEILLHKKKQQISAEKQVKDTERDTEAPYHFKSCAEAFPDPGIFAGTNVLGCKIRDPVADGGKGCDNQAIQLYGGRIPCHDRGSESVDNTLNHDIAQGDKTLLQDTGHGNCQDLF